MRPPRQPASATPTTVPAPPPTGRATPLTRSQLPVLTLLMAGTVVTSLNSSIVNVSLPAIARAFDAPVGGRVEWVIIAYLVVAAALLLSVGRLADLFGRTPL